MEIVDIETETLEFCNRQLCFPEKKFVLYLWEMHYTVGGYCNISVYISIKGCVLEKF